MNKKKLISTIILGLIFILLAIRLTYIFTACKEKATIEKLNENVCPEVNNFYDEFFKGSSITKKSIDVYRDQDTKKYMVVMSLYTHPLMEATVLLEDKTQFINHAYWYDVQKEITYLCKYFKNEYAVNKDTEYTFGIKLYSLRYDTLLCFVDEYGKVYYIRGEEYTEDNEPDVSLGGGIESLDESFNDPTSNILGIEGLNNDN